VASPNVTKLNQRLACPHLGAAQQALSATWRARDRWRCPVAQHPTLEPRTAHRDAPAVTSGTTAPSPQAGVDYPTASLAPVPTRHHLCWISHIHVSAGAPSQSPRTRRTANHWAGDTSSHWARVSGWRPLRRDCHGWLLMMGGVSLRQASMREQEQPKFVEQPNSTFIGAGADWMAALEGGKNWRQTAVERDCTTARERVRRRRKNKGGG
jgi:hypothetical protein